MLYLSCLLVNGRSQEARRDLSDCQALHRRVLSAFPDAAEAPAARERFGVLFRAEPLDGGARVLAQSRERPDWSRLPEGYLRESVWGPKPIDHLFARLTDGQELVFRLLANPTRRINDHSTLETAKWHGKRVELQREEDQIAWLHRKGAANGFTLLGVRTKPEIADLRTLGAPGKVMGRYGGERLTFGAVMFEGRLRVTEADAFRQALEHGIGSGKAYGFGLLSVASA